ncbi:MAG: SirB1 family protein [Thiotrichales bacterium]
MVDLATALNQYLTDQTANLLGASFLVARHARPELQPKTYEKVLRGWGEQLNERLANVETQLDRITILNKFVYQDLGFTGNYDNYYDPKNSLIDEVIERRTGIPLTLSIIYMELARQAGIELEGTSFPGHFLVKLPLDEGLVVLDPYNHGISLDEDDLKQILKNSKLKPTEDLLKQSLRSPTPREAIIRMLRNLKIVYMKTGEKEMALEILNLMLTLEPELLEELRERGMLLKELECHHSAIDDLAQYLASSKSEKYVESVRNTILDLQSGLAPLH